jgi:hypothetical protein
MILLIVSVPRSPGTWKVKLRAASALHPQPLGPFPLADHLRFSSARNSAECGCPLFFGAAIGLDVPDDVDKLPQGARLFRCFDQGDRSKLFYLRLLLTTLWSKPTPFYFLREAAG